MEYHSRGLQEKLIKAKISQLLHRSVFWKELHGVFHGRSCFTRKTASKAICDEAEAMPKRPYSSSLCFAVLQQLKLKQAKLYQMGLKSSKMHSNQGAVGGHACDPQSISPTRMCGLFFCYLGRNEEVSLVQYINSWQTSKKILEYFFAEQFSFAAETLFQQQKKIVSAI